jgi:hypothetical protein
MVELLKSLHAVEVIKLSSPFIPLLEGETDMGDIYGMG